jgi:membrane-bound lytic murein transglycosylase D
MALFRERSSRGWSRSTGALIALALAVCLAGCEESAKRFVQARPPAEIPPSQPQSFPDLPWPIHAANATPLISLPPRGVELLLARVEAAFQTGEEEYKAGHINQARSDFDHAVDLLLKSGFELQSDPRLSALFDRVVETIHRYELAAASEGGDAGEPKGEPAPIDEIAGMTLPPPGSVDPNLTARAERELRAISHDLPLTVNEYVLTYLNFFQTPRGRAIVETGLRRAGRYRPMISRVLREEGLPQDLIYLAQAESAFQPVAVSRAGARGMWQFMAYRAREYGLHKSWWVDERQDPEKATRAAARHLRDLYRQFGDWYLVLAAYDSGPGNVTKAIERTGYADFWELYKRNVLPRETKNYVPIIVALTLMAKDSERYGLQVDADPPLRADVVKPGQPIDLRLVAETIDVDVETLRALNPALLRMATPADPNFELRLPAGSAEQFSAEIADIPPDKWLSWRRHRVEAGETLLIIARKYRVTAQAVADVNNLEPRAALEPGSKLIIPAAARPQTASGKLVRYRVRRGDTLESIADEFDVTVAELKRWNGVRGNRVARGVRLKVYPGGRVPPPKTPAREPAAASAPAGGTTPKPGSQGLVYQVKPGETLWSIARAFETSVDALRAANRFLSSRQLQTGDQLRIPARQ